MFRNQYDSDVTVWSPQGRLHQVEYAMEAVKLGSATVGLKNKQYAVLIALKRAVSELSAYQKKVIPIDSHIGISISGLTADARMLSRYMRTECLNYRYAHDAPMPVGRLITMVGNKMQICTQRYDKRPLGVGLLVAGYDDQGPHIYQTCPSANYFDCRAMAIGARSQSARTYLEKHLSTFIDCDLQELVAHGLRALRDTLPNEVDLNTKNVSIAIVGPNTPLRVSDEEELSRYLALVEGEERRGGTGTATGDAGSEPAGEPEPQAVSTLTPTLNISPTNNLLPYGLVNYTLPGALVNSTANSTTLQSCFFNNTLLSTPVNSSLPSTFLNSSLPNSSLPSTGVGRILPGTLVNCSLSNDSHSTLVSTLVNNSLPSTLANSSLPNALVNSTLSSTLVNSTLSSSTLVNSFTSSTASSTSELNAPHSITLMPSALKLSSDLELDRPSDLKLFPAEFDYYALYPSNMNVKNRQ